MEGWKATQGKLCIFKRAMGLQNFKGSENTHV
jgi:hypothetical protein